MNTSRKIPIIDVVIPVYNGEKFVLDAIRSVEAQTVQPHKIFIVDDGSTDNTKNVIEKYIHDSPSLAVYIHKENGGPNSARNLGLSRSEAEFVAFLDADDRWKKDKLEKQIAVFKLKEFSNLGLVYCNYEIIKEDGSKDDQGYRVTLDPTIKGAVFEKLLIGNKILSSASGVLIKREVFDRVGVFDESFRFAEDWDMWLRIAEKCEVGFVDEVLVEIRRHSGNQTNTLQKVFLGEIDFFNKWADRLKNYHTLPIRWADQIAFHTLVQIPHFGFIQMAHYKISSVARKKIFKQTFGSIWLYCCVFLVRKILTPQEWKRLFEKFTQRYAK
jgi:glycosyltransferase involved in cell wall biosynthesis